LHAEFNASKEKPVHLLQMWVLPPKNGLKPAWSQRAYSREEKTNNWLCVVSPDKKDHAQLIHQRAKMHVSILKKGHSLTWKPAYEKQYLFVVNGNVLVNNHSMFTQDAARIAGEKSITLKALENTHIVAWDTADARDDDEDSDSNSELLD